MCAQQTDIQQEEEDPVGRGVEVKGRDIKKKNHLNQTHGILKREALRLGWTSKVGPQGSICPSWKQPVSCRWAESSWTSICLVMRMLFGRRIDACPFFELELETRVSLAGINFSKTGLSSGQQASMIAVLACAKHHIIDGAAS